ncbi:MAG: histidine kinase [Bacteroidota bacterium]
MFSIEEEFSGWSLKRILRHALYWGFWLTFYGTLNAAYQGTGYQQWFYLELMLMTIKLPYAYFVAYVLFPRFLRKKKYFLLFAQVLALAFVGILFMTFLFKTFPEIARDQPTAFWSAKTFFRAVDLIYVASLVVVIKMIQRFMRQERANTQLKQEKIGSELQILKNQLQPHFLMNTLNNIYGLVLDGDKKAAKTIIQLSNIINYMLYECDTRFTELEKEIELIKDYLQLEKIRYGKRLNLSFEVIGAISELQIAPLLLIPFVENAFKHGVSQIESDSWIRILIEIEGNLLTFQISNNTSLIASDAQEVKSGIGLENVKKRLRLIYPQSHDISITSGEIFSVILKLWL